MQRPEKNATQRPRQQRIAAIARQLGTGVVEQVVEIGIQRRVARRLEQLRQQARIVVADVLIIQIDDQHAIVALAGKFVLGMPGHQAGAHAANLAT